jgi:hypothetical protein
MMDVEIIYTEFEEKLLKDFKTFLETAVATNTFKIESDSRVEIIKKGLFKYNVYQAINDFICSHPYKMLYHERFKYKTCADDSIGGLITSKYTAIKQSIKRRGTKLGWSERQLAQLALGRLDGSNKKHSSSTPSGKKPSKRLKILNAINNAHPSAFSVYEPEIEFDQKEYVTSNSEPISGDLLPLKNCWKRWTGVI